MNLSPKKYHLFFLVIASTLFAPLLASASMDGPPLQSIDVTQIPNPTPTFEPLSIYGNPPSYRVYGKIYHVKYQSKGYHARGIASWYGTKFDKKRTSSGEPYDMFAMTAAHKTLPLPCYVRVTNLENGRNIIVRVNDRGPFHENRLIDLSYTAAKKLGILEKGTGLVDIQAIDPSHPEMTAAPIPDHVPQIYLQIGAFADASNAARQADKVRQVIAEPIQIDTGQYLGRPIYRVQIGPLPDVSLSDQITEMLKTAGLGSAIAMIR
jgi:peptidoglycan lytic transglycosylase